MQLCLLSIKTRKVHLLKVCRKCGRVMSKKLWIYNCSTRILLMILVPVCSFLDDVFIFKLIALMVVGSFVVNCLDLEFCHYTGDPKYKCPTPSTSSYSLLEYVLFANTELLVYSIFQLNNTQNCMHCQWMHISIGPYPT
jgi:hypothetical protein